VLNDETRGIVGEAELRVLPPHATVVNVSRGPIIDEAALAAAVLEDRIAGVGIDVFGQEPLNRAEHPFAALIDDDRCIFTPHLAFWTAEARDRLQAESLERCVEALEGRPLTVLSHDPRLVAQASDGSAAEVVLGGVSTASGRWVAPPPG
jgi:D-3-phosphoglycerate dehydrogenase